MKIPIWLKVSLPALPLFLAMSVAVGAGKTVRVPDFDRRDEAAKGFRGPTAPQVAAAAQLREEIPQLRVDFDPLSGSPRTVASWTGFLTGTNGGGKTVSLQSASAVAVADPDLPVKTFLNEHRDLFGHGAEALAGARVLRAYATPHNRMRTAVWQQQVGDIPVFEAVLLANTTRRGELVNVASHFLPDLSGVSGAQPTAPAVSARRAVSVAATRSGELVGEGEIFPLGAPEPGAEQKQKFQSARLSGETTAGLVWLPMSRSELRLCWDVIFTSRSRGEMFRALVDAHSGEALLRRCLTRDISDATYRVFTSDSPSPFSPGHATPQTNQPPLTSRALVTLAALDTNASPAGWIPDGGNQTLGNNVDAHTDRDDNDQPDLPRPQGSPFRVFDFPMNLATQDPTNYSAAAVVQLFFTCNWMHDRLYQLGFTEAAGNFQTDNFGRGGAGSDAVQADAQDGGDFNNANMGTPPDGSPPRMQMYIFSGPSPRRDGDFDAEVVLHEYTHGLSTRLVGGGVGINALQTGGMGEGWSDFYALSLLSEPDDAVNGVYAFGGYATFRLAGPGDAQNYYFGIRRYPYTTDLAKNPLTFNDLDPAQADNCVSPAPYHTAQFGTCSGSGAAEVHNQGELWCVTLWDARANLIAQHGWEVGNELILQIITDGMKLSPANPNFLEARDAILQADLVDTGGANQAELWAAFAKRGMGIGATSPASSTTTGVFESFDIPDDLRITPLKGFVASGPVGGPFNILLQAYAFTNVSAAPLDWSVINTSAWLNVSAPSGTLPPGGPAVSVEVALTAAADALPQGVYPATLRFTNHTSGRVQSLAYTLRVGQPDNFTQQFGAGDASLDFQSWMFTPNGGPDFYSVCRAPVVNFPTDPAGGNPVSLTDDSFVKVTLSGLNSVAIYHRRTNVFFIGSNGYLTFDKGDTTYSPSPQNHFQQPRVSAMFNDLLPINGAPVSWKELNNRVAVTWQGVPEYGTMNNNNLQIEMFFDGRVRITHLQVDAVSGLIGLSAGQGLPTNFFQSEFTAYPACLPSLSLQMPAQTTEGAGVLAGQGQVGIAAALGANLTVTLTSALTNTITVPANVVIPAGQTSATFDVTVVDDAILNGTRQAGVTATAAGYVGDTAYTAVDDNETAQLAVQLPASAGEGAGTVTGIVSASAAPGAAVLVQLSSSDTTEATVPATMFLPAGQTSAVFTVTIINDNISDGPQDATITAHVPNWADGSAIISVLDDDTNVVAMFNHGPYVDTGIAAGEQASLADMGVAVTTFTDIISATNSQIILFPSFQNGDLAAVLTTAQKGALSNFVMHGGTLIVNGTYSTTSSSGAFLNAVFGWYLLEAGTEAPYFLQTETVTNTEFADDDPFVLNNSDTGVLLTKSLPPGAQVLYGGGDECAAALFSRGQGLVIYLGWDWFYALPLGFQDGGWLGLLDSAVQQKPLAPVALIQPGGAVVQTGDCGGSSVLDPGENVTVDFGLVNAGNSATTNLVATLLSTNGVTFPGTPRSYGVLTPGDPPAFKTFSFIAGGACGGAVQAQLQLMDGSNDLGIVTFDFTLGTPTDAVLAENFDSGITPALPPGWTTSTTGAGQGWTTTSSRFDTPSKSAFAPNKEGTGQEFLISPSFFLPTNGGPLTFRHAYDTETCCDAGSLQISTNGGAFTDILAAGGYFLTNGYNADNGWRGRSEGFPGFVTTAVRLPAAALGKNVRLRWRMANDPLFHVEGWYVDTISISNHTCCYDIPVAFLPPSLSSNRVILRFNTTFGKNYSVQYKGSLDETNWVTYQTVPGDGTIKFVPPVITTNAARLYRLLVP